ncbi:MAG: PTS sugar transporter subunit IIB [Deltaproteobacteria bacterium]|nr:PTS sugar transporter subunit IIB [Deltaproteobacteria bacterium]
MSIVLVRIDDRLLHGQIVEAWVPSCKATCIIVANDEAKKSRIQRLAIESCSSRVLTVKVESIEESMKDITLDSANKERVIIIFSTLKDLMQAYNKGFRFTYLNIGNLHHDGKGKMITPSLYIDPEDEGILHCLKDMGVKLDVRAVPSDKPVPW